MLIFREFDNIMSSLIKRARESSSPEGIEEIKLFLKLHQTVDISTQEHSRLPGDCFGVHLLIFDFKF